ncbi:CPBP family intramembrane glutamic endopeptidase [Halobellus rufus]|uniref:CPBP family intramembrane glutamic endopeptidase n=1 Tax=Halobellus rufus TaxID=1448860 RepID=UPI0009DF6C50|nr:CPBP family intramembrane glutamic endopeptidase [Halobellus rufus]
MPSETPGPVGTADPAEHDDAEQPDARTPQRGREHSEVDVDRLARFLGALVVLALGFVAVASAADVRLVALAPIYMFTPAIAAGVVVLTTDASAHDLGVRRGRARWHLVAVGSVLALIGVALALSLAVPGITFDAAADPTPGLALPAGPLGTVALLALVVGAGVTVNALFALGEEIGWRGYLLWELAPLGFWRASGATGVLWGLWHAPVVLDGYNYPSFPVVGVAAMTVATVAFSPVYTYVVVRARSALAAGFLHGVFNAAAGSVLAYAVAPDPVRRELVASPVGVAGIAAFALASVALRVRGTPSVERASLWEGGESTESANVGSDAGLRE